MAGDAEIANNLLLFHFKQSFHGSALGENLIDVKDGSHVVQLPQIDVIGVKQFEGLFDHAERSVAGALLGFRG